jgi:hypothetical protein
MYKPKHFITQEFVPPDVYKQYGEKSLTLLDLNLLLTADLVREFFNKPMTINTWHLGGQFSQRGFRPKTSTVGVINSRHRMGDALDFDIAGLSAATVRKTILANKNHNAFKYIMRMEDLVNWVHIDLKPTTNRILLFNP